MAIMDGLKVSKELLLALRDEVNELESKHVIPKLAVILVGSDPASLVYVRQKQRAADACGIAWEQFDFAPEDITTESLIAKIEQLNINDLFHGILVQLPLPKHIEVPLVMKAIDPKKDVDGFTAYNLGKMFLNKQFEDLAPCTPTGVIHLLDHYGVEVQGKEVVVVGHSNIVGKPLATMLLNRDATVTVCHIHTKDLAAHTRRADILCVAVGKPNLITGEMVKEGAVVVDIGINRMEDGKLCGDTNFAEVSAKASLITPVPGGVGPMTVACLMENTVKAAKRANNLN